MFLSQLGARMALPRSALAYPFWLLPFAFAEVRRRGGLLHCRLIFPENDFPAPNKYFKGPGVLVPCKNPVQWVLSSV